MVTLVAVSTARKVGVTQCLVDLQPPSEMDPDWGASSTEEETPQGSTAALGGFASHLTGLLRAALSNRAWSTVTSKSPASQKASSDSDSPVDHGKETPQLVATNKTP